MKKNHYLVIGLPRSGTTVIHLLLRGHPSIAALNDELKVSPFFSKGISTFTFGNDVSEEKDLGFSVLFDAISSISGKSNTTVAGAKCVCHSSIEARTAVSTLQGYLKNLKVILVVRNDLVAQCGSMISARKSGVFHSWSKEFESRKINKFKINKWVFTRYAIKCLGLLEILRELHNTHDIIECIYEDFVSDPAGVYKQLADFLNVPQVDATWLKSKKLMPDPNEYIKNYSEMRTLLEHLRVQHKRGSISTITMIIAKVVGYRMLNIKLVYLGLRRYLRPLGFTKK